ncbi:hypothetical protein [Pseudoalteromonas sp.]|uniref:hypothetical protein n=1 Tax=Pseudoalteromonas TaxID=53246 RepID=UPI003F9DBFEB
MGPVNQSAKIRNGQARLRFTCDLIQSINKANAFDGSISLGHGLVLSDIVENTVTRGDGRYLEFAGVSLHYNHKGTVFIRAKYIDDYTGKGKTQSFSLQAHGIKEAFIQAVKYRAEKCGFTGAIPEDLLYIPTEEELTSYATLTKGYDWVERNNIKKQLQEAC